MFSNFNIIFISTIKIIYGNDTIANKTQLVLKIDGFGKLTY